MLVEAWLCLFFPPLVATCLFFSLQCYLEKDQASKLTIKDSWFGKLIWLGNFSFPFTSFFPALLQSVSMLLNKRRLRTHHGATAFPCLMFGRFMPRWLLSVCITATLGWHLFDPKTCFCFSVSFLCKGSEITQGPTVQPQPCAFADRHGRWDYIPLFNAFVSWLLLLQRKRCKACSSQGVVQSEAWCGSPPAEAGCSYSASSSHLSFIRSATVRPLSGKFLWRVADRVTVVHFMHKKLALLARSSPSGSVEE